VQSAWRPRLSARAAPQKNCGGPGGGRARVGRSRSADSGKPCTQCTHYFAEDQFIGIRGKRLWERHFFPRAPSAPSDPHNIYIYAARPGGRPVRRGSVCLSLSLQFSGCTGCTGITVDFIDEFTKIIGSTFFGSGCTGCTALPPVPNTARSCSERDFRPGRWRVVRRIVPSVQVHLRRLGDFRQCDA
jgi:hypothetical protein